MTSMAPAGKSRPKSPARRPAAKAPAPKAASKKRGSPRALAGTLLTRLDKHFGEIRLSELATVLEKSVYLILREGSTHQATLAALDVLRTDFVDWNEVRASRPSELSRMIAGQSKATVLRKLHDRTRRVHDLIDQIYNDRNEASMEFVLELKAKERLDYLSDLDGLGAHNAAALAQWLSGEDKLGQINAAFAKAAELVGLVDSSSPTRVRKELASVVESERLVAFQAHLSALGELEEPWPSSLSDLKA
ncbi:MAG: hypothetical protein ACT4PU_02595 [Planctomycetota bacterium]